MNDTLRGVFLGVLSSITCQGKPLTVFSSSFRLQSSPRAPRARLAVARGSMRPRRLAGVVALTLSTLLHTLPSGAGESPTLSAGSRHTCAIDASDALHCWGDDARGQSSPPPLDPPGSGWRAVTASKGGCHTCGLTLRGEARCWGCDDHGETTGVPAVADDRWIALAAGNGFTCGVAAVDRAIRCWGRFLPQIPAPSQPPWYGPWAAVTAGEDWVCALRRSDRTARCRGWSAAGQAVVPERLANVAFDAVSAGFAHTCGVASEDRSVRCWGEDLFGEASAAPNAGGVVLSDAGYFVGRRGYVRPRRPLPRPMGRRRRRRAVDVRRSGRGAVAPVLGPDAGLPGRGQGGVR